MNIEEQRIQWAKEVFSEYHRSTPVTEYSVIGAMVEYLKRHGGDSPVVGEDWQALYNSKLVEETQLKQEITRLELKIAELTGELNTANAKINELNSKKASKKDTTADNA